MPEHNVTVKQHTIYKAAVTMPADTEIFVSEVDAIDHVQAGAEPVDGWIADCLECDWLGNPTAQEADSEAQAQGHRDETAAANP